MFVFRSEEIKRAIISQLNCSICDEAIFFSRSTAKAAKVLFASDSSNARSSRMIFPVITLALSSVNTKLSKVFVIQFFKSGTSLNISFTTHSISLRNNAVFDAMWFFDQFRADSVLEFSTSVMKLT
ncbi:hypothetical protein D3C85_1322380 [compost metagenome]